MTRDLLYTNDVVRDSVIGLVPLIAGNLFAAYITIYQMQLLSLWGLLQGAQWDLSRAALKAVPALFNI